MVSISALAAPKDFFAAVLNALPSPLIFIRMPAIAPDLVSIRRSRSTPIARLDASASAIALAMNPKRALGEFIVLPPAGLARAEAKVDNPSLALQRSDHLARRIAPGALIIGLGHD
jgi:hypothetical protein